MRAKTAIAAAVVLGALAMPTTALSQTALVTTNGKLGKGSLSVGPISLKYKSDVARVSANTGAGEGSAATADADTVGQVVHASVGCIEAHAAALKSSLDATLGDCGSAGGGGGTGAGGGGGGGGGGGAGGGGGGPCGCVGEALGNLGSVLPGAVLGDVAHGQPGDSAGDDTGNADEGDDGTGAAGDVSGDEAGSGQSDQSNGGAGGRGCSTFERMASASAFGAVPLWALVLGAFFAGVFARRRSGSRPI